jgi:ribose transport system substrate-binding protein
MKSLALLLFSLVAIVGCGNKEGPGASGSGAAKIYQIAVIPKGTSHEFWKSIHAGAVKAERELGEQGTKVNVNWQGPLREDDRDQQIRVVETFTVRRFDAIVLAPLDSQALIAPVEAALAAKVPVVIIDSGLNSEKPISYVATDNFRGGQIGAEYLGKVLNGQGKVILLRYQVGSASTEMREAGFLQVMTNKFPNIQLLSTDQYSGATRDSAYQAAQNLMNRFGREANGVFAPCEPVTIGMMLALKDVGKGAGAIKLVGFDAGSQSVEGLKKGDVAALVVQNPVRMGYLGVKTAVDYLQGKPISKVVDTGVQLVTPENMEQPEVKELLYPPLDKYLK